MLVDMAPDSASLIGLSANIILSVLLPFSIMHNISDTKETDKITTNTQNKHFIFMGQHNNHIYTAHKFVREYDTEEEKKVAYTYYHARRCYTLSIQAEQHFYETFK